MSEKKCPDRGAITRETIHNPDNPKHFMRVKPVPGYVRILFEGKVLAESDNAMRLLETGRDIYDPVLYFPPSDIRATLAQVEKQTFCPLKGHASYHDLVSDRGEVQAQHIAWSYDETLDFADSIKGLMAFDATRVVIEEHPKR